MPRFPLKPRPSHVLGAALALAAFGLVLAASAAEKDQPGASAPGTFKLRARTVKAEGTAPAEAKCTITFAHDRKRGVVSTGGEWSEWLEFDAELLKKTRAQYPNSPGNKYVVVHVQFQPLKTVTIVEAEAIFDGQEGTFALRGELSGSRLGVIVDRDEKGACRAQTMAQYNRRYWKCLENEPFPEAERPRLFPVIDRYIGGDDDVISWREGIENLSRGGFSVIMLPPEARLRGILTSLGLKRTAWAVYCPPGYAFDYDLKDPAKELETWAQKEAKPYLAAGYEPKDMAFFALCDEPGWYLPATFRALEKNAAGLARFRQYLKDQGLKAEDLGLASLDEAKPLGVSGATTLPAKRLFYWSVRFLSWDSTRFLGEATRALEKAFYPGLPIAVNWNNFQGRFYVPGPLFHNQDKKSPDAAMMHQDWLEFGRLRGCTMLWTEDWFDDSLGPQWSYYCRRLACAARKGGVEFGGYVIPRAAGQLEDGILQKILCVAGHGGKAIKYFVFGPEYSFPGNCYSERAQKVLPSMARAHRVIGKAEDVIWPGRPPKSDIAILYPRSAQPWDANGIVDATNVVPANDTVDYLAEVYCLHKVFQRVNIPVDFVEEEDLSPEGLKGYKLLCVTAPNIPLEGQKGLAEWVQAGGALITVDGAGSRDRYNEPADVLAKALGIEQKPRPPLNVKKVSQLRPAATGKAGDAAFTAKGLRGEIVRHAGTVRAAFDDGSPAIVEAAVGQGRVLHFAFLPACSSWDLSGLKSLWPWLVDWPQKTANVDPPVRTDLLPDESRGVEAPLLLSDAGAAVTLLNWSRKEQAEFSVSVRVPFKPKAVESVTHGPLKWEERDGRVSFRLPLKYADVIRLTPGGK